MKELFYLNIKWFMVPLLNMKDSMSMSNRLEDRAPFADYKIVEYIFNIPWSIKYCDNMERRLLRRELNGILPEEVLYRRKSPYSQRHNPEYLQIVKRWMGEILSSKTSPILNVIDKSRVQEIIDTDAKAFFRPWYGKLMTRPQLLAYLIQVNFWIESYNVKIE